MGYRWKAWSKTRTMAVSVGRSDVLGAQEYDRAETPRSRVFRGRFLPPKPTKNRIRSYPMGRAVITHPYGDIFGVFTGFGGHPGCLCVKTRVFWRIYGFWRRILLYLRLFTHARSSSGPTILWRRLWRPPKHVKTHFQYVFRMFLVRFQYVLRNNVGF